MSFYAYNLGRSWIVEPEAELVRIFFLAAASWGV